MYMSRCLNCPLVNKNEQISHRDVRYLSFLFPAVVFGVAFQSYKKFVQGCVLQYTYLLNRQTGKIFPEELRTAALFEMLESG
jgi:hypothetical protein